MYFLAIEITRRRFASTISFFATALLSRPSEPAGRCGGIRGCRRRHRWPTCAISPRSSSILSVDLLDHRLPAASRPFQPIRSSQLGSSSSPRYSSMNSRRLIRGWSASLHHALIDRHDAAVDAVELVDQGFDPVVVQVQVVHQSTISVRSFWYLVSLFAKSCRLRSASQTSAVLHLGQFGIVLCDDCQRFQNAGFQSRFHRRQ